ncbi:hypothetical protein LSG25_10930 [Paralcaligenes sp. KSB-10]|uniref:sarcosine oxidase subunit gamma n=1 Tax=Paralcaligenes sp. KSB-10 TaxID=2901142 RepID=UPI001E5F75EF|nr:sarcosine oxidase subunit gamma family protein [Paralcaligenes sp. KSB-10]UHL62605.1 hypothetical protein LSG25_10930 [Paralcaligenes sp. KSB-10]
MVDHPLQYQSALADSPVVGELPVRKHRMGLSELPVDCVLVAAYAGSPDIAPSIARIAGVAAPGAPGLASIAGPVSMLPIAPNTWQIATTPNTGTAIALALKSELGSLAAVTDLSFGRIVAIALRGDDSHLVLEKGIGIDFSDAAFAAGRVVATGLHAVHVLIVKTTPGSFHILVPRSFALSILEWLVDAIEEFKV